MSATRTSSTSSSSRGTWDPALRSDGLARRGSGARRLPVAAGRGPASATRRTFAWQIQTFFLLCVAVAGVYGAATVKRSILFVQTVPSAIGLALVLLAHQAGG
ncbi:DUF1304 family protein [Sorangium sp. So ce291]|uniref:DUF1304 family protein n=1 Tax=Sorangium sp. So ce291 TaxID=3133294 RepID=UPI003F642A47